MPNPAIGLIGASVGGSAIQGLSASKAAKAGERAADQADETNRYIFDRQVDLTEPQRDIGNNALAALAFESGVGPRPTTRGINSQIRRVPGTQGTQGGQPQRVFQRSASGDDGQWVMQAGGGTAGTGPQFFVGDEQFDTRRDARSYLQEQPQNAFNYTPQDRPDPNLDLSTAAFEASPGYQFRIDEGQKALERAAAARGMRFSGGAMKDAMRFGQGIGSQEYGNFVGRETDQFNRSYGVLQDDLNALRGLSGVGQTATQAQISAGNNYATGVSNNAMNRGNAQAQGAIGVGNAFAGGINSGAGIYGQAMSGYLGQNPGLGIKPVFDPFSTGAT